MSTPYCDAVTSSRVVRAPASTQRCIGWERAAVCVRARVSVRCCARTMQRARRRADRAQSLGERLRCEVPDQHVIFVLRHGHRDRVRIAGRFHAIVLRCGSSRGGFSRGAAFRRCRRCTLRASSSRPRCAHSVKHTVSSARANKKGINKRTVCRRRLRCPFPTLGSQRVLPTYC